MTLADRRRMVAGAHFDVGRHRGFDSGGSDAERIQRTGAVPEQFQRRYRRSKT